MSTKNDTLKTLVWENVNDPNTIANALIGILEELERLENKIDAHVNRPTYGELDP